MWIFLKALSEIQHQSKSTDLQKDMKLKTASSHDLSFVRTYKEKNDVNQMSFELRYFRETL